MAEVKLSMEEYHNVVKSLNTLIEKLYEMTKKCSDYKRQRDELINDMAEVKSKAEILDELEEMFETSANANRKHGFNGGAEFYERYLDIIRERGSDE
ncbi:MULTISPECIES: hypothetical protein [Bacillales]|uniref:hypothetical protein n=1 Tax=Bacillales TaxID=1385 RepID=UPI000AB60C15|nr:MULTISPECIES: hypothetical protein [Bacillales]MCH4390357.1 hypothetical protein [Staphylococcus haemolyticus]MCI2942675.1 hypothetical protein [Staphylococcus haemolyticus]MCI2944773.1 hypothetical protein [Staphylococcus haemolyticus]MEB2655247.1 hypothetical protein [Staphylococcus haemolyticus]